MSYDKARENLLRLYSEFLKDAHTPEDLKRIPGYDPNSLERAAASLKLDYENPAHLSLLVRLLADLQFGMRKPGRQKGHKTEWTEDKEFLLACAYFDLKRRHPDFNDTEIRDLICKIEEFKDYDSETLRIAHDPETLRKKLSGLLSQYEEWADDGEVWDYVCND
jgi:hypothetical protein